MLSKKLGLFLLVMGLTACFFIFDLNQYFSLEYFQSQKNQLLEYKNNAPIEAAAIYFFAYVAITALSLPAAAIATLAGGAIFGLTQGFILVSFASTIGATLAFLIARILFRDSLEKKFSQAFKRINTGVEKEGAFYLFGLRLVPVFPFFAVNLVMGLTKMPIRHFFLVSQAGMLPGTLVYVNAGTQIAQLQSLSDIATPGILISFALLGLLPLLSSRLLSYINAKKVYKGFNRPSHFDTNMVVIGAGSGGLVTSYIAAATKAKVTLIEKHKMGGDCLNTGCVPSKALIKSAAVAHQVNNASAFGVQSKVEHVDFTKVMTRIKDVIGEIEPHDSVERYTELGVDCIQGEARIVDPYRVEVNGATITTRNIVIATGARPSLPPIDGIEACPYYNSDTIWDLKTQPKNLLVLGAGPIGCELAQSFLRLGSSVTILTRSGRVLPKEDGDVAALVKSKLEDEGLSFLQASSIKQITAGTTPGKHSLEYEQNGMHQTITFDCLLLATGRTPNTKGFGAEELDLELNENGTFEVNEYLQTKFPNIYAVGDVAGPYQLTHAASHQAWYAAVNGLFGGIKKFKADYRVIPWATFTDPEIARVGFSETEAIASDTPYEVTRYDLGDLDRAIADGANFGIVKVLTVPGSDKILGACIVGKHAGDLLAEFVLAMKQNIGLNKILGTIHTYPTLMEANKYLAGEWKRAHTPTLAMKLLPKFHSWMRK